MTIPDLLTELGIKYVGHGEHNHTTAGWVNIDCSRCSPGSGKYRLGIPLDSKGQASCWLCGSIRLHNCLAEITGLKASAIWPLLAKVGLVTKEDARTPLRGRLRKPKGIVETLHNAHRRYLRDRGFKNVDRISEEWGIKAITIDARLGWRLYLPIMLRGREVSWTTRSLSDKGMRYISASPDEEIISHKRLLYGINKAKDTIVVVEGPLDAIAIGPGAVCTFGLSYTPAQVRQMAEFPTRVIAYDSEPQAQRQARKLCDELESMPGRTCRVELTSGKDAASCDRKEVQQLQQQFLD